MKTNWLYCCLAIFCTLTTVSQASDDLADLVSKIEKSVVRIDTVSGAGHGTGSGVIVDVRGGVLTNYHVIEGATEVVVTLRTGAMLKSEGYLAIDPTHDLALIKTAKVDDTTGIAVKVAGKLPRVGERVAAFGNPKGFSFTTSEGIVSAIRKGSEVVESIGRDAYSHLGYATDATWVQTTAPISPGNSGGPLVTMNGELVGLNTWNRTDGQNLNFAISLLDIRRVLDGKSFDKAPQHFADMPRNRAKPVPTTPSKSGSRADFKLELPTGRVFSYSVFDVGADDVRQSSTSNSDNQVLIRHANGALYAAAEQSGGLLNGTTVGQYENKSRMVYLTYINGKRHGVMKIWSESGEPMLFAQYAQGKRHGFSCWHVDGSLRLLLQYNRDQLVWAQLMSGETPLEGFKTRVDAEKNEIAAEQFKKLDEYEANIKKTEIAFRKQVKEFEMQRRKALAAQLAPEKRRMQSARGAARAAAEDAFTRELYRKAYGR
jgi:S1-C subfamily serine protease